VLRALTLAGVRALTSRPPTLEELFIKYYASSAGASTTSAEHDDDAVAAR
jgi:ABC-2 type transport system ATP-binding protein